MSAPVSLPAEEGSEAEVLGFLLGATPESASDLVARLRPDHFHGRGHREMFEAVVALLERGDSVDPLLVVGEMTRRGSIERVRNGPLGVERIYAEVGLPHNVGTHVERVIDAHARRRVITIARRIIEAAREGNDFSRFVVDLTVPDRGDAEPFEYISLLGLLERVEQVDASFLIDPIWPADAYGVIGAQDKAGKTWAMVDLAVSIVTGTPWLGIFPCEAGPVHLLYGEGGARNLYRRLDAVCRGRGLGLSDLLGDGALRIALAVPRLTNAAHVRAVSTQLTVHPARAVLLDPFYLAAPGGKGADLYAMGEALYGVQSACQDAGAGLVVSTHWNKTGEGTGASRFSGVGPSAWGRVLGSGAVIQSARDTDGASVVTIGWEFSGGEIPETTFRTRRRVWAEDPHDLESPIHYEIQRVEDAKPLNPTIAGFSPSTRRVYAAIGVEPTTVREIGDVAARDGQGYALTARTIQRALRELQDAGLVDGEKPDRPTDPSRWWAL